MLARTGPVSRTRPPTPERLYGTESAANAHGMTTHPLHAVSWSGDSGASEAPKSTARAATCAIRVPDRVRVWVTFVQYACWLAEFLCGAGGNTTVAPFPTGEPASGFADARSVVPAATATAATTAATSASASARLSP